MSETNTIMSSKTSNDKKMIIAMASIGIICALLIVMTYEGTKSVIEKNKAEALEKAVFQVIPGISKTKTFKLNPDQTLSEISNNDPNTKKVYAGYDEGGKFKGVAFQGSGKGYGDLLSLLFGYDPEQQKIVGFYVLESKETPGIGDKIEKDPFLSNMKTIDVAVSEDQTTLKNEIKTVKNGEKTNSWEIDAITGATITSRAVGNIINKSGKEWIPTLFKNKKVFLSNDKTKK